MSKTVKLGMEHRKFAFDKEMEPAASIESGDSVVLETEDSNSAPKATDKLTSCRSLRQRMLTVV